MTKLPIRIAPLPEEEVLMALARKQKVTVYDAAYLELAKRGAIALGDARS